ncbi:MAG: response regulator [Clostridia bacterium]|nr:response regulator [Clostridia bacterium]
MSGERILVVDDDRSIRLLLTQCLEEAGYKVTSAVDGEHALEKAEEGSHDLVMLDMKLPGMDGVSVLKRIRTLVPDQLVVIITAHGTIETAVEAMKAGAADYLQKPFTPDEIRAIVQHNLAKKTDVAQTQGSGNADARSFTPDQRVAEARALLREGDAVNAVPRLLLALNQDPARADVFNLMGVADEKRGSIPAAQRMYRVAVALDPSYAPAERNLDRVCQWHYSPSGIDLGDLE